MLKYALNNCENKAASPQKAPQPKTSVEGVRRVAKFFKRQPVRVEQEGSAEQKHVLTALPVHACG